MTNVIYIKIQLKIYTPILMLPACGKKEKYFKSIMTYYLEALTDFRTGYSCLLQSLRNNNDNGYGNVIRIGCGCRHHVHKVGPSLTKTYNSTNA